MSQIEFIQYQMIQQEISPKRGKIFNIILHNQVVRVFLLEFICCIFLTFIAPSIAELPPYQDHPHDKNPYRLVYVALIVYLIVCFIGPLTGAHINPAVTLLAYLQRKKRHGQKLVILAYILASFLGCLGGCLLGRAIMGNGGPIFETMPDVLLMGKFCIQEFLATFIFLFSILIVTTDETTFIYDQAWVHLMIGIVYYLGLTLSSKLHLLNPAVVFGFQVQAMIHGEGNASAIPACLLIILSQMLGAGFADLVFRKVYMKVYVNWKKILS